MYRKKKFNTNERDYLAHRKIYSLPKVIIEIILADLANQDLIPEGLLQIE